jgi:NAD(P)H-flavin reductase
VARSFDAGFVAPPRASTAVGRVSETLAASGLDLSGSDAYVAGPRITVRDSIAALGARGVPGDRIFADSYGV